MEPTRAQQRRAAVVEFPASHIIAERRYATGMAIAMYFAAVYLLLHLLTAGRYGYFGDEMYYMDCARHLDWGYVDQPPVVALVAWFVRHLLGDSLFALRLLPAISGVARIVLAAILARELGASRGGMVLAAIATFSALIYWPLDHLFTMNTFEPLIWMGCAYIVIRTIKTGNQRLWVWFGLLAGVGMETKYSMGIFGVGVVLGLLLTSERKAFAQKWIWIAGAIAFAIFLPNLIWNVQHDWPFVELMRNINASGRDIKLSPVPFIVTQILIMNPLTFPVWLAGVIWLFFSAGGRRFRALGWAFVVTFGIILLLKGKSYYVAPAYPLAFAAGGVALDTLWSRSRLNWLTPAYSVVTIAVVAALMPVGLPILSPEAYLRYQSKLPFKMPVEERGHLRSPMPHHYAFMFGWPEMVAAVARTYNNLPPEERARTAIFAQNFAEAGAIDLLGKKYGLPDAISGHQNYWLWGPRKYTGETVIVLGSRPQTELEHFESVQVMAELNNPYASGWENRPVLLCRKPKFGSLGDIWPELKNWD